MIKLNFFSYRLPLTTSGSLSMSLFFFLEMIYKKKISSCVKVKYTSWKKDTYQGILEKKCLRRKFDNNNNWAVIICNNLDINSFQKVFKSQDLH